MPVAPYSYALAAAIPAPPEGKEIIAFTHLSLELLLLGGFLVAALALPKAIPLSGLDSSSDYLARLGRRLRLTLGTVSLVHIPAAFLQVGWSSAKAARTTLWEGFAPDALAKLYTAAPKNGEWIGAGGEAVLEAALTLVLAGIGIWLLASGRQQAAGSKTAPRLLAAGAITGTVMLAPALPSSFTGLTVQSVLGPLASQSHILSSAVWVGGLVFLTLLLLPRPRHLDGGLKADAAAFAINRARAHSRTDSVFALALAGLGVMVLLFWGSAKASYRRSLA